MSDCSNSITKYVIVEATQTGGGAFSGLTVCGGGGLTVDFITGCTSDGVNVEGGIFNNGVLTIPTINTTTLSGGTFYGDGSNLTGISTIDSYMTGGTYSNGFITFSGSGVFSDVTVDVSALLDDTNSYITGSTLNGDTLELSRNGGLSTLTTDLSSINTDNFVSGGTYLNGNLFFSGTSTNQTFSVDVSALLDDTNSYVTGGTLSGTDLVLGRNGGLSNVTTDLSSLLFTGNTSGSCITDLHISNLYGCSPITVHDDIIMSTGTKIKADGILQGYVDLNTSDRVTIGNRTGGSDGAVLILNGDGLTSTATFQSGGFAQGINTSNLSVTNGNVIANLYKLPFSTWGRFGMSANDVAEVNVLDYPTYPFYGGSQNIQIVTGVTNAGAIGMDGGKIKTNNTLYTNQMGFNAGAAFETILDHTTATQDNVATLQDASGTIAYLGDLTGFTTGNTLAETLTLGNTTANGQTIQAENGSAVLDLRANSTDGSITLIGGQSTYLQGGTFGATGTSYQTLTPDAMSFGYFNQTFTKVGFMGTVNNDGVVVSSSAQPHYPTVFATQNVNVPIGVINTAVGGGINVIGKTDNTFYSNQFGFNSGASFETLLNHTTATQDNQITLPDASGTVVLNTDLGAYLPLTGGTMTGDIDMTGQKLTTSNGVGSIFFNGDYIDYDADAHRFSSGTAGVTNYSFQANSPNGITFLLVNPSFSRIGNFGLQNNDVQQSGSGSGLNYPCNFSVADYVLEAGIGNSVLLAGDELTLKTSNVAYAQQFGFNKGHEVFETLLNHTTPTADRLITLQDGDGTLAFLGDLTGFTSTDYYVTGATMNGNSLELGRNGLSDVTVDLSQFVDSDTSVTGLTYNPATFNLTVSQDNGKPSYVSNLAALASDIFVLSGVYDVSTGIVTYTTNSGTTFEVSGFTSGMTDSYTTDANLSGNEIQFNNNIQGTNLYNVDLTPILSGKTNNMDFYSYTASTQIILDSKTDNTDFWSHTGDTNNPHQTSFSNLTSTGHTHTLSEITDFSSYSGSVQTQIDSKVDNSTFTSYTASTQTSLDSKVDDSTFISYTANTQNILNTKVDGGINVGGGHEVFSGITGTDMNFRTLSGGSNTTLTTVGDVIRIDVVVPTTSGTTDGNDYVTGSTMNGNTLELGRNGGLSTLTTDLSQFIDNTDNFVTGGTMVGNTLVLNRTNALSAVTVDMSQFVNTDTNYFTTGGTYTTGNIFFSGNSVDTSFIVDVSALLDDTNSYVTGGTVSGTDLILGRNGGLLDVTIDTSAYFDNTDNFVTGATMNVNTLELSRSGGLSNVTVDLSQFVDDTNDGVVSGATMNGNTLELGRTQGLTDVTVDLSQFIDTDSYVTGSTLNGNTLELSRNGGLPTLSTDLSGLNPDTTLDRKLFIPASMASDMGSSSIVYHGTTGVGLLGFGGQNPDNEQGAFPMVVPQDYVSGGTFELIYTSQSTVDDIVWSFGINNASNGVDFSTFTESGPHMDLVVSGQTFLNRGTSQVMTPTGTTFNTNDAVTVRVNRDASDSRDTANNITGYIYGLIFNYKANN
jgi:hypothetical protein